MRRRLRLHCIALHCIALNCASRKARAAVSVCAAAADLNPAPIPPCAVALSSPSRTAECTPEGFHLLSTEPLRCGCAAAIVLFVPALRASVSLRSLILDGNAIGFVGGREVRQHTECSAVD